MFQLGRWRVAFSLRTQCRNVDGRLDPGGETAATSDQKEAGRRALLQRRADSCVVSGVGRVDAAKALSGPVGEPASVPERQMAGTPS